MKKKQWVLVSIALWMAAATAWAQMGEAPTVAKVLSQSVSGVEGEIVPAAEAMPEDKFNFAPSNGEFKGVRTFGQQIKHVAAVNFLVGASLLGEKPREGGEIGPDSIKTKAEIVNYLKESFAYVHKAIDLTTDKNVLESVKSPFGEGTFTRLRLATIIVGHCFDHYGQMVEYLRMNGIIPPASRG